VDGKVLEKLLELIKQMGVKTIREVRDWFVGRGCEKITQSVEFSHKNDWLL